MKSTNLKHTRLLLDFIIKQELLLEDYPSLKPRIQENFIVYKKGGGITHYANELLTDIIDWENGKQFSSLEKLIDDNYVIIKRI